MVEKNIVLDRKHKIRCELCNRLMRFKEEEVSGEDMRWLYYPVEDFWCHFDCMIYIKGEVTYHP